MKYIEHLIEPERLLLCWQALNSRQRSRHIVGELIRKSGKVVLKYFEGKPDFNEAIEKGFTGYPAFQIKSGKIYENEVLEAFTRRLPPRSRSDFYRYLELRSINPDSEISDFALLGYTGAKLPDDGFEIVHPFDNINGDFEFVSEVAGFRHESEIAAEDVQIGERVQFIEEPENAYDDQAIRIEINGKKIGYVDRGHLGIFHSHFRSAHNISGEVVRKNGTVDRPLIYIYTCIRESLH
jgi:hypothetical protein